MMPLADDYFRLAHNEATGTPRISPYALGIGLATALLGELIVEQRIDPRKGHIGLRYNIPTAPADALTHGILDQLRAQYTTTDIRTWIEYLSRGAHQQVAHRLMQSGYVKMTEVRRLFKKATVWQPTDLVAASTPWVNLTIALRREESITWHNGFLLCLADATGLGQFLLRDLTESARKHYAALCQSAPPEITALTDITASIIGDTVLSYRQ